MTKGQKGIAIGLGIAVLAYVGYVFWKKHKAKQSAGSAQAPLAGSIGQLPAPIASSIAQSQNGSSTSTGGTSSVQTIFANDPSGTPYVPTTGRYVPTTGRYVPTTGRITPPSPTEITGKY